MRRRKDYMGDESGSRGMDGNETDGEMGRWGERLSWRAGELEKDRAREGSSWERTALGSWGEMELRRD
jgi:hypothetical protein